MPVSTSYFDSPLVTPSASSFVAEEKSAIQMAKDALYADTAEGKYLSLIGQNYNIRRPQLAPGNDEIYRRLIMAIGLLPKTILSTLYFVMEAVFGSQASYVAQDQRPWKVYVVNPNELIIEIPFELLGTANENATYLHGFSSLVVSGATTTVFTCLGDATRAAVTLVGLGASVYINGAYEEKTITIATYNAVTDQTQITVGSAYSGAPIASASFFVNVPGDGVSAYRGDYVAQTAYVKSVATSVAPNSLTDSTLAMTTNQYVGYFLRSAPDVVFKIASNTATSFSLSAGGATPPLGPYVVNKFFVDASEAADGSDTPPHDDRIYVTGDGKFEIVKQYLLDLLLAAGVVLRLEKV